MRKPVLALLLLVAAIVSSQAQTTPSAEEIVVSPGGDVRAALERAAKSGGGKVHLLPGRYVVEAMLRIPSNTILEGAGPTTVISPTLAIGQSDSRNNRILRNWDDSGGDRNIIIRDLAVDGRRLGVYHKTGIYGICLSNTTNCMIENVLVTNCSGEGILVNYGDGKTIVRNCVVIGNNHGINVHHCRGAVVLEGNRLERNKSIGIFCENACNMVITNNLCTNNAWWGIVWMGGEPRFGSTYNAVITNNVCRQNNNAGIFVHGTYSRTGCVVVANNVCAENRREGIWVYKAHDAVVTGNLLRNNDRGNLGLPDLRLTQSKRVVVHDNVCCNDRAGNRTAVNEQSELTTNRDNLFVDRGRATAGALPTAHVAIPGDPHEAEARSKRPETIDAVEDAKRWRISVENRGSQSPLRASLSLGSEAPYCGRKYLDVTVSKPNDNRDGYPDISYTFEHPYNWGDYAYLSLAVKTDLAKGSLRVYVKDTAGRFMMFGYSEGLRLSAVGRSKWTLLRLPFAQANEVSAGFDISQVKSLHLVMDIPPGTRGRLKIDALGLGHAYSLPKDNPPAD